MFAWTSSSGDFCVPWAIEQNDPNIAVIDSSVLFIRDDALPVEPGSAQPRVKGIKKPVMTTGLRISEVLLICSSNNNEN